MKRLPFLLLTSFFLSSCFWPPTMWITATETYKEGTISFKYMDRIEKEFRFKRDKYYLLSIKVQATEKHGSIVWFVQGTQVYDKGPFDKNTLEVLPKEIIYGQSFKNAKTVIEAKPLIDGVNYLIVIGVAGFDNGWKNRFLFPIQTCFKKEK